MNRRLRRRLERYALRLLPEPPPPAVSVPRTDPLPHMHSLDTLRPHGVVGRIPAVRPMSAEFKCPGCGQTATLIGVVGIATFFGERHTYTLCPACAVAIKKTPQRIAERVELTLAKSKGTS
jgi:hypothetical protein